MTVTGDAGHLDPAELRRVARGRKDASPVARGHLATCLDCREELEMITMLMSATGGGAGSVSACPEPGNLVDYAEGLLSRSARVEVDAHLTDCRPCAIELELLARGSAAAGAMPVAEPREQRSPLAGLADLFRNLVSFEMPPLVAVVARGAAPATSVAEFALAVDAQGRGDHERVVALLEGPARAGTASPEMLLCLGASLRSIDRAEEAIPHLEAAVRAQPKRAESAWQLAQALLQVARAEEAAKHLRRVARLQGPRRRDARTLAARVDEAIGAGGA